MEKKNYFNLLIGKKDKINNKREYFIREPFEKSDDILFHKFNKEILKKNYDYCFFCQDDVLFIYSKTNFLFK
jgi:hypothetical protein